MIGSAAGKTKKIIFTSFGESAGKSYVSYNLAKTLTFSGHRVVLVDLDLRKGTLSHRAGIIGKGVTEYLSDPTVQVEQYRPILRSSSWASVSTNLLISSANSLTSSSLTTCPSVVSLMLLSPIV